MMRYEYKCPACGEVVKLMLPYKLPRSALHACPRCNKIMELQK